MLSLLFSALLSGTAPSSEDAYYRAQDERAAACFENGYARGRLAQIVKMQDLMHWKVTPESRSILAAPIPKACNGSHY